MESSATAKDAPLRESSVSKSSWRSPMDSSTYRHLLGQLNNSSGISHHNFPSHNLLSLETLLEVSQDLNCDGIDSGAEFLGSFPCYQPFPYKAQKSSVLFCGSGLKDSAAGLVRKKMIWERKLKSLRVSNINAALKHMEEMRHNKTVKLSSNLKRYVEHFYSDPEPMFSGSYNWLYTGGCLYCDEDFDGMTLVAADCFTKQPGFNVLKLSKCQNEIQCKFSCYLKTHSPVYQITCKPQQENLVICIRQKNYISLFSRKRIPYDSHPVKLWRKKVLGSKLLTCVDIKDNCEEILVADSSHDVHIFHKDRRDKVYCQSGKKIAFDFHRDCWSQASFGELGIYWAFRNCFTILDARDFGSGTKLQYMPASATSNCEEICSFISSPGDSNFVYLATTHSVLQLDLRMGQPVQRWTHLMKNPPQFMTSVKEGETNEIVVLQSHAVGETSGIVNECTKGGASVHFVSKSLPCLLQSIKESLKLARFHGLCLSPFVTKRLNFAVTGIQCLKNGQGDVTLFYTNSGGDVFQSKIKKRTSERFAADEDDQQVLDTMKMLETHCEKFPTGDSTNSHVQYTDMSHVLKGHEQPEASTEKQTEPEIYWKYEEMYSPNSLKFFKDVLAQKILKVWGHGLQESDYEPMSVDSKVREWMDRFTE